MFWPREISMTNDDDNLREHPNAGVVAQDAAEAIRTLQQLTEGSDGLNYPGNVL